MSDGAYIIPDYAAMPPDACFWPACAQPLCERSASGQCPLSDHYIVDCPKCGAAYALGESCAACGAKS